MLPAPHIDTVEGNEVWCDNRGLGRRDRGCSAEERHWCDVKRGAGHQCRHRLYKQLTSDQIKKWGHDSWTKQVLKKKKRKKKYSIYAKNSPCMVNLDAVRTCKPKKEE